MIRRVLAGHTQPPSTLTAPTSTTSERAMVSLRGRRDPAREGNIRLMRPQYFAKIRVDMIVAYSRQGLAQLADDPALSTIEEGNTFAKVGNRDCLLIKGTDLRRRRDAERLEMTRQHGTPTRFISLNIRHQLRYRPAACCASALESDPGAGALCFEQLIEKGD